MENTARYWTVIRDKEKGKYKIIFQKQTGPYWLSKGVTFYPAFLNF